MIRTFLAPILAAAVLFAPVKASAVDAATACAAAKLGASGKYAAARLKCASKAAKTGAAVDSECLSKASLKHSESFAGADEKAGTACNGSAAASVATLDKVTADLQAIVPVPGAGSKCASSALVAESKFASAIFKAKATDLKSPDATKLAGALLKARTSLEGAFTKAVLAGCASVGQDDAARTAADDGLDSIYLCVASPGGCVEVVDDLPANGTATSDQGGDGPDATEQVTAEVQTPNAGTVVIVVAETAAPEGYEILGKGIEITAPAASAAVPLTLTFVVDASLVPLDPADVTITRNGVAATACTGAPGTADPDPCVTSRTLLGNGDLQIVVLTSHASTWLPVVALPPATCPNAMRLTTEADTDSVDTATEIDLGWSGRIHNVDRLDAAHLALALDCSAATPAPECNGCTVTGLYPDPDNCRCANNKRTICDEPFVADTDDCGGAACECYTSPPLPAVVGGTPICVVGKARTSPSGTWNVAAGSGDFTLAEALLLYTGASLQGPCPICIGDPTPNDHLQGGSCSGGPSNGLACDGHGSDPTFDGGAGGWQSYDCMPSPGSLFANLYSDRSEVTGNSELTSTLPCTGSAGSCPCAVCSADSSVPCSSDAECIAVGAGTCTSSGFGASTRPNPCSDGMCNVTGTDGTCATDFDMYCDGFVEEDGKGVIACSNDATCTGFSTPTFDAGTCSVFEARSCFGPTIGATGIASSTSPLTVSTACFPASGNPSADSVAGLPGPVRTVTQWSVLYNVQ